MQFAAENEIIELMEMVQKRLLKLRDGEIVKQVIQNHRYTMAGKGYEIKNLTSPPLPPSKFLKNLLIQIQ
jgi:hypothetical protein